MTWPKTFHRIEYGHAVTLRGWFTGEEGVVLAELAADVPAHAAIVEIGPFAGRSTAFLTAGVTAGNGAHITSLDDWSPAALPAGTDQHEADEVFEEFKRVTDFAYVTPLRARSTWVAPYWVQPIGLLFLDATHVYEDTVRDLDEWGQHVYSGGHAALHDYHPDHPGVVQAVDEATARGGWVLVSLVGSLCVLRKVV